MTTPSAFQSLRDGRTVCLGAAFVLLIAAALAPSFETERKAYDVLAAVDITGSMNARDYISDGRPQSRLEKVKRVLRDLLTKLPCGSRLGLALFTERRSFLLFEPIAICDAYAPLDGAIATLDWRMAFEGDSRVTLGLHSAMRLAKSIGADLLFLTDGHEAPPLSHDGPPPFEEEAGVVHGIVVGVGGTTLVPIPRFDRDGHEAGFYAMDDVPQENRLGPPPQAAETREGWHPRNAPFGAKAARGNEHLTSVREDHLRAIAKAAGLSYQRLSDSHDLAEALSTTLHPHPITAQADLSPIPAALALLFFLVLFGTLPLFEHRATTLTHNLRTTS
jgi:mxaL protein